MTMRGTVCEVKESSLLVCDRENYQQVLVQTPCAQQFHVCDQVCIQYSGAMTDSLPPQISAYHVTYIC